MANSSGRITSSGVVSSVNNAEFHIDFQKSELLSTSR